VSCSSRRDGSGSTIVGLRLEEEEEEGGEGRRREVSIQWWGVAVVCTIFTYECMNDTLPY